MFKSTPVGQKLTLLVELAIKHGIAIPTSSVFGPPHCDYVPSDALVKTLTNRTWDTGLIKKDWHYVNFYYHAVGKNMFGNMSVSYQPLTVEYTLDMLDNLEEWAMTMILQGHLFSQKNLK